MAEFVQTLSAIINNMTTSFADELGGLQLDECYYCYRRAAVCERSLTEPLD